MEELINKLKQFKASEGDKEAKAMEDAIKEAIEDLQFYNVALAIFDEREYRKKYLEERRKEQPDFFYPDADEIYKRYYEQQEQLQEKDMIMDLMGELIEKHLSSFWWYEIGADTESKKDIIEYFTKKAREV